MTIDQIKENFFNGVRNSNKQVVATPVAKLAEESKISVHARTKYKEAYNAGYTKLSDIDTVVFGLPTQDEDGEWFTTDYYIKANLLQEVIYGAPLKEMLENAEAKKSTVFNKLKSLGLHKIKKESDKGVYYKIVEGAKFTDSNIGIKKSSRDANGKYVSTTVWVNIKVAMEAIKARQEDVSNLSNL